MDLAASHSEVPESLAGLPSKSFVMFRAASATAPSVPASSVETVSAGTESKPASSSYSWIFPTIPSTKNVMFS